MKENKIRYNRKRNLFVACVCISAFLSISCQTNSPKAPIDTASEGAGVILEPTGLIMNTDDEIPYSLKQPEAQREQIASSTMTFEFTDGEVPPTFDTSTAPEEEIPEQSSQIEPEKQEIDTPGSAETTEKQTPKLTAAETIKTPDVPETIIVTEESGENFPILSIQFRLSGKNKKPITNLKETDITIAFPSSTIENATWSEGASMPLERYFPDTPQAVNGIVSLKKNESPEENLYHLTFVDRDWNPGSKERTYQITIQSPPYEFHHDITATPVDDVLQKWREREWAAALGTIEETGDVDAVMNTLLTRYSITNLTPFLESMREWAQGTYLDIDVSRSIQILDRLQEILRESDTGKKRSPKYYERLADLLMDKEKPYEAIQYYEQAIKIQPSEAVYEKILNCQLAIFDYAGARLSAKWLYTHGARAEGDDELLGIQARAYSGEFQFSSAESILYNRLRIPPWNNSLWLHLPLFWKGYWHGIAARSLASVLPSVKKRSEFEEITKEYQDMEDVRWIGFIDSAGVIVFSTAPELEGKNLRVLYPSMRHLDLSRINNPIWVDWEEERFRVAAIIVPARKGEAKGAVVFCYDNRLRALEEQSMVRQIQSEPMNEKTWLALKTHLAYTCGSQMTKTLGRVFKAQSLTWDNWVKATLNARAWLAEPEYIIVAGRKKQDGAIEILHTEPPSIPDVILNNTKANQNPYFLYETHTWNEKTIHEMTTAVYQEKQWLGTLRIGYTLE